MQIMISGSLIASVMGPDACGSEEGKQFNEIFQRYKTISSEKAVNFWYLIDLIWKLHPKSREYSRIIDELNSTIRKVVS